MRKIFRKGFFLYFLIFFILFFILWFFVWMYKNFGRINLDEIAIVLQIGLNGVDHSLLWSFIKKVILRSFGWGIIYAIFYQLISKYKILQIMSFVVLVGLIIYNGHKSNIELGSFFNNKKSNFYEQEYIYPDKTDITFSEKKNTLVIVLESMEKTFNDKKLFGAHGLIPNITKLERENISFKKYHSISGLSHTIAAITGITTGLPLFYTSFKSIEKMLGTTGIGTIFKNNDYGTYALFPASGKFSLKTNFLKRMGFDTIYDGERLRKLLTYKLSEYPFNGVDDGTFFELSKPILTKIINKREPYFIMMETINTHCKGYFTEACREKGFKQENMEDIIMCEDKLVYDFINWFRNKDPKAIIIVINDHQQKSGNIMNKLNKNKERALNNIFINTNIFNYDYTERKISAMDFFPTIIEAAGGKIDGCKLGLGVSLSEKCRHIKTLRERYDDKKLEKKMEQKNDLYYKLVTGIKK